MNKKGETANMMEEIQNYHLQMRALQLSQMNDDNFGLTHPFYVYSHDQVQIELADQNEKTIETKGVGEVYDAVSTDTNLKRFCTLNLFGCMRIRPDKENFPKPHVVFK